MADIEAAIESYRAAEQAFQTRVRELEEAQAHLREQVEQIKQASPGTSADGSNPSLAHTQARENSSLDWVLGGIAFFASTLCIIFLLRMRQPASVPKPETVAGTDNPDNPDTQRSASDDTAPPSTVGTMPPTPPPFIPTLPDWDPASPEFDLQAMKAFALEENVKNYDSTIELAEIMLSFGRVNSAAEALSNFIENNPKDAFAPWLKLLEVYRTSGQRAEFDKIAQKLNKTFNVWTVDWDNFNDVRDPVHQLEGMPHILERLQRIWGLRECQAYLQYLLRDTRGKTRDGFPLAAIDDILCLNAILEYNLGPYTGPANAFPDYAENESAPPTETEGEQQHLEIFLSQEPSLVIDAEDIEAMNKAREENKVLAENEVSIEDALLVKDEMLMEYEVLVEDEIPDEIPEVVLETEISLENEVQIEGESQAAGQDQDDPQETDKL